MQTTVRRPPAELLADAQPSSTDEDVRAPGLRPSRTPSIWSRWEAQVLALVLVASLASLLPANPLSALLTLTVVCTVPGVLLLDHLRLGSLTSRAVAAVTVSLAVQTLAAVTMVWLEVWHPRVLAAAIWAGSAMVLCLRLLRTTTDRFDPEDVARP